MTLQTNSEIGIGTVLVHHADQYVVVILDDSRQLWMALDREWITLAKLDGLFNVGVLWVKQSSAPPIVALE